MGRACKEKVEGVATRTQTIDITHEQSVFCPFCSGTDIVRVDEAALGYMSTTDFWRCNECKGEFEVRQLLMLVYAEPIPTPEQSGRCAAAGRQICNECGRSACLGSGRFVNRVPDLNSVEERQKLGKPFPEGDYVCAECDSRTHEEASS